MVAKGIFPYVSKQESAINAGESFFQVCVMQQQHVFVLSELVLYFIVNLVDVYDENLGNLKCFWCHKPQW